MKTRTSRAEQTEVVHAEILAAARAEFLAAGYHGATLDRIAAAAGYTKGAVYSRYESKADLFLALLEQRIEARAALNSELEAGTGPEGVVRLLEQAAALQRRDLDWTLLVTEFRIHAARHPELLVRYAALHRRALDGFAARLDELVAPGGPPRGTTTRQLAYTLFSLGNGDALELAVDPEAPQPPIARMVHALLTEEDG